MLNFDHSTSFFFVGEVYIGHTEGFNRKSVVFYLLNSKTGGRIVEGVCFSMIRFYE